MHAVVADTRHELRSREAMHWVDKDNAAVVRSDPSELSGYSESVVVTA